MVPSGRGYTDYYKGRSQYINKNFRHLRHNESKRNESDDGYATFEDFVNFLLSRNNTKGDRHFLTFLTSCQVCDAQYDYIIKMETFQSDIDYLKQKLNLSAYLQKVVFPKEKYKANDDTTKKIFETIPKSLALELYKKYQKDFEMFGYEKPVWLC